MSEERYFQISIFMPLLIPIVLRALGTVIEFGSILQTVYGIAYSSILLAGIPYGITATLTLVYLYGRKIEAYYKAARIAPWVFLPVFAIYVYKTELLGRTSASVADIFGSFIWAAVLVLPIGYLYVAIVLLVAKCLFKTTVQS